MIVQVNDLFKRLATDLAVSRRFPTDSKQSTVYKPLVENSNHKMAQHSFLNAGPTTKVDAGEEHPGPTHTAQRLAKDGVVASKRPAVIFTSEPAASDLQASSHQCRALGLLLHF